MSAAELGLAAKQRGNVEFGKNTREGYEAAIVEYSAAVESDPAVHVYHANLAAAYLELGKLVWQKPRKVEALARGLLAARRCTELNTTWIKGFVRTAALEHELVSERQAWKEDRAREEARRAAANGEDDELAADLDAADPPPDESLLPCVEAASLQQVESTCRAGLILERGNTKLRLRLQELRDQGYATDEAADRALADPEAAAGPKAEGNAAFSQKRYEAAVGHYTAAAAQDPFGHVFFSNRSACFATHDLDAGEKALRDADRCLELAPSFVKGHSRRATALFLLGRYPEAESAARAGLSADPENAALKETLAAACTETRESAGVQAQMHRFRADKRKNDKMRKMLSGLNLGSNVQMFNGGMGGGLEGLLSGMGGGGGGSGMSEAQMRQMARGMESAEGAAAPSAAPTPVEATVEIVEDDGEDDGIVV